MVKLNEKDIIDREKGKTAVICAHGPSLREHLIQIINLREEGKIVRFAANNWFNFVTDIHIPDYWVLASNVDTISAYLGIMNKCEESTIIFADSVDLTDYEVIEENLKPDYFAYDQRHFQGDSCLEILMNFKNHHTENKNFNFLKYGNNSVMWQPPFDGTPGGVDIKGRCCHRIVKGRKTIQEMLQEYSNHEEHYSTASSVTFHMIAMAILMGCEKIYIAGMDLDYDLGYANENIPTPQDIWKNNPGTRSLLNDLRIINESANKKGVEIINLQDKAWYGTFKEKQNIDIDVKNDFRVRHL